MKRNFEDILESIFTHIVGIALVLSGLYEAIFNDVSWTVYLPLLLLGFFFIKSPLSKIYNVSLEWIKSKIK